MIDEIKLFVHIRRNDDGLVRIYETSMQSETIADGTFDYMWSDGNYSCDCNRGLFFAYVVGDDDPNVTCGDAAYSVRIFDGDNKQIYSDGVWGGGDKK